MDWAQTSLQPDFLIGVFWGFLIEPPSRKEIGLPSRSGSTDAPGTSNSWIDCLQTEPSFWVIELTLADIPIGTNL